MPEPSTFAAALRAARTRRVCEVIGGRDGEPFDAAGSLREAKHWARVAAGAA